VGWLQRQRDDPRPLPRRDRRGPAGFGSIGQSRHPALGEAPSNAAHLHDGVADPFGNVHPGQALRHQQDRSGASAESHRRRRGALPALQTSQFNLPKPKGLIRNGQELALNTSPR